MPRPPNPVLPAVDLRRVAVAAEVDPRTVQSYLRGGRLLPASQRAVEAALRAGGHGHLVRAAEAPAGNGAAA